MTSGEAERSTYAARDGRTPLVPLFIFPLIPGARIEEAKAGGVQRPVLQTDRAAHRLSPARPDWESLGAALLLQNLHRLGEIDLEHVIVVERVLDSSGYVDCVANPPRHQLSWPAHGQPVKAERSVSFSTYN
jgi:hypothetical protein